MVGTVLLYVGLLFHTLIVTYLNVDGRGPLWSTVPHPATTTERPAGMVLPGDSNAIGWMYREYFTELPHILNKIVSLLSNNYCTVLVDILDHGNVVLPPVANVVRMNRHPADPPPDLALPPPDAVLA